MKSFEVYPQTETITRLKFRPMTIAEMPPDLPPRERLGVWVGVFYGVLAEAGLLGLGLLLWALYSTLRRP
jgi:hypothetical protein